MSRSEDPTTRGGRGRVYQEPDYPTARRDPPTQGRAARPAQPAAPREDARYRSQAPDLEWPPRAAAPARTQPQPQTRAPAAGLQPQFDPYVTQPPTAGARAEPAFVPEPPPAQKLAPRAAASPQRRVAAAPPPDTWQDELTVAPRQAPASERRAAPAMRAEPAGRQAAPRHAPQPAARQAPPVAYPPAEPDYEDEPALRPDPGRRPAPSARHARNAPEPADYADDAYEQGDGYQDQADGYRDQGYEDQADDGYAEGEHGEEDYDEEGYEDEPPKSRRGLIVVGALVAAVAIGGGLGFVYKLTSESSSAGKPKIVQADKRPVKTQPEEQGGQTFDGTGKQVYERLGGTAADSDAGVVSSEEPLIDRTDEDAVIPGITLSEDLPVEQPKKRKAVASAEGAQEDGVSTAPRKVQPVLIKPGETITDDSTPMPGVVVPASASDETASATVTKAKKKAKAVVEQAADAESTDALSGTIEDASAEDVLTAATKKATKKKQPTAEQQVAVNTAAAAAAPAVESAGGYVVQVRASTSRMDALGSFADLQQKYGDLLASGQPDIQEFKKGEQTWYRLRIGPPASKQVASGLCSKLKSSGLKECIVTRY